MARDDDQDPSDRPQDEIVGRLRPDPAQPPEPSVTLTGFLGDSDREGFRRLYFSRALDYYAEFRAEDVLATAAIPADQQPFAGEEATRVTLRQAATVEYTHVRAARPVDEFDIDVRLGGPVSGLEPPIFLTGPGDTFCGRCPATPGTCAETCGTCATNCGTCPTNCVTCDQATCEGTCATNCGTCARATCQGTCVTECGTCATDCGTCAATDCGTCARATCGGTCQTCGRATCGEQTCNTCVTNCGTCGEQTCVTCSETCQRTCAATCFTCPTCEGETCAFTCAGPRCFLGPR